MTSILKHWRAVGLGACCAAAGIGAGAVATAGASTSGGSSSSSTATHHQRSHPRAGRRALARRSVHGSVVVAGKSGFRTITWDRGTVSSVNDDRITLTEGTPKATYKTVTLTIPSDARIRDNGAKTTLASIKPGQRAVVLRRPKRTLVIAHTPKAGHGL